VQTSTFKIGILTLGKKIAKFQQQPRFADSRLTHDANDLTFS
jgi:hypothetical protein